MIRKRQAVFFAGMVMGIRGASFSGKENRGDDILYLPGATLKMEKRKSKT
ncbi:MAG: hypothetical protein AB1568_07630 [Thermodesulfobacteriota bacterium]